MRSNDAFLILLFSLLTTLSETDTSMGKHIGVRDSRVDELLISSMWNGSSPPQGCICITNETAVTGLNSKLELILSLRHVFWRFFMHIKTYFHHFSRSWEGSCIYSAPSQDPSVVQREASRMREVIFFGAFGKESEESHLTALWRYKAMCLWCLS